MPPSGDFPQQLESLRLWDDSPLPAGLRYRLGQEWEQVTALTQRIVQLEAERRALIQAAEDAVMHKVQQLLTLKGIGTNSAWVFGMEFFGWRTFRNGKEVGALRGLTPTPYARGPPPMSAVSPKLVTIISARGPVKWPGAGGAFTPSVRSRAGLSSALAMGGVACAGWAWSR
jgi:hypothetical protein